jgi:hypothetical protein
VDQSPVSDNDELTPESELRHRLRHGQTDLDDAIALLRSMKLEDTPPASNFDPGWEDVNP